MKAATIGLRTCRGCDRLRYAPCSVACRVPDERDPRSWEPFVVGYDEQEARCDQP